MSAIPTSAGHDTGDQSGADASDGEGWAGARAWPPGSGSGPFGGCAPRQQLMHTLHAEIIPRLLRSHRPPPVDLPCHVPSAIGEDGVEAFVRECIAGDPDAHERAFAAFRSDGHALPELYLQLLTPAARRLGALWNTDDCSFPEVTLGMFRLQSLLHALNDEFCAQPVHREPQHRILLAPVPGSHHTFGFYMLTQFFRRDGWSVCSAVEAETAALVSAARADWYDVVALSVSCTTELDALATLVHGVRCSSLNPRVGIMVGGPLGMDAEVRARLGAEAYSGDAPDALRAAHRLVRERDRPN